MFYVYILLCSDNSYYTGHTDDIEKRLHEHQMGIFRCYTKNRQPYKLVFQQSFTTRGEALRAECQIKGWSRKKKEAMINGDWNEVSKLARKKTIHLTNGD